MNEKRMEAASWCVARALNAPAYAGGRLGWDGTGRDGVGLERVCVGGGLQSPA